VAAIAPGGPIDLESRIYLPRIGSLLKESFVLDFKPGAAGTIGASYVAKAKPDGYTIMVISAGFTVFPAFYKDLSFDVVKDFSAISLMSERTSVLQVRASFPASTFSEYLAYAKANPGKINYGTTGVGSITHLAGAWMHGETNTKVTFIPFKGTGPLLQDLAAGRVDVASGTLIAALPLIKSGKVRAIAILNDKRSDLLRNVPTVAESGAPDYNYANWIGFVGPRGMPSSIISRLSENFAKVARDPAVVSILNSQGSIAVGSAPAHFAKLIETETQRWKNVVVENKIEIVE
jgi:tripartite-type tricarboxylate transporter receptor subunit TctC